MDQGGQGLSINGLIMPRDFPVLAYESVYKRVEPRAKSAPEIYEHFAAAWNAVAHRYFAVAECDTQLTVSLAMKEGDLSPSARYRQERDLFDFFSSGFSVFEASFYGLYSLGALLAPTSFPMATAKDLQRITPTTTATAFQRVFPNGTLNDTLAILQSDSSYLEWREVRNILTHRAAPGRTFFVGIGDEVLPDEWKIKSIRLDDRMSASRRAILSGQAADLLKAIENFVGRHF